MNESEVEHGRISKRNAHSLGEEARQFEVRMLHPKPLSEERIARIMRDYELMRKKCVNCSF